LRERHWAERQVENGLVQKGQGIARLLQYLARYTHRVAISNGRLLELSDGRVTIRYKDYADAGRDKRLTLPAEEFLRRLLQHVLPKGLVKVRHYGLLANRHRAGRLHLSRRLLLVATVAGLCDTVAAPVVEAAPAPSCPCCGSARLVYRPLPAAAAGAAAPSDSS
jgi:hypothetical protein